MLTPAVFLAGLACKDSTSPTTRSPLSIVAGSGATDTILTKLTQALVVEVRGNDGEPLAGQVVRFTSLPSTSPYGYAGALVAAVTTNQYGYFLADSTDANGRAAAVVQLGIVAGPAKILVEVPDLGLQDTARYTVLPGAAASVLIINRDTAVTAGTQYSISASASDRYGNKRPNDPITFTSRSAVATVDAAGKVIAVQEGRGTILVQTGTYTDSAQVSVVPLHELVVWCDCGGKLVSVNTDGTQSQVLTTSIEHSLFPQWSPDGQKVLIYERDPGYNAYISTVDMTGTRTIITGPNDSLSAASYGRYTRDGSWIYFTAAAKSDYGFLTYRVKPDGTQLERVGPDFANGGSLRPDVSLDGKTEIFQSASGTLGSMDIATHTVKSYGVSGLFPRYSPDGTQIAYLASGQSGSLQLFVMNADGSNSRQLTAAQVSYQDLSGVDWSPDGKWLLASTYNGLELVRVSDGQRLPLRVPGFQAAFKP
jgi:hypothetical protein